MWDDESFCLGHHLLLTEELSDVRSCAGRSSTALRTSLSNASLVVATVVGTGEADADVVDEAKRDKKTSSSSSSRAAGPAVSAAAESSCANNARTAERLS